MGCVLFHSGTCCYMEWSCGLCRSWRIITVLCLSINNIIMLARGIFGMFRGHGSTWCILFRCSFDRQFAKLSLLQKESRFPVCHNSPSMINMSKAGMMRYQNSTWLLDRNHGNDDTYRARSCSCSFLLRCMASLHTRGAYWLSRCGMQWKIIVLAHNACKTVTFNVNVMAADHVKSYLSLATCSESAINLRGTKREHYSKCDTRRHEPMGEMTTGWYI